MRRALLLSAEVLVLLIVISGLVFWYSQGTGGLVDKTSFTKEDFLKMMAERPAVSLTNMEKTAMLGAMSKNPSTQPAPLTASDKAALLKAMAENR